MAVKVTSTPVSLPTGIRATTGKFDFNATTYSAGGLAATIAQWGGGANGIPNRFPDFVIFNAGTASDDGDTDFSTQFAYNGAAGGGKVGIYGEEALTADSGLAEQDAEAATATATFLALWLTPDPVGSSTV